MIDIKDIKTGLRFVASMDGKWFMDNSGNKRIFVVTGFSCHKGDVYVDTDTNNSFLLRAFLGQSERYEIMYADYEYEEGEIALKYMNEQREKAIASEGSKQFERITIKMLNTYKAKNHDYGNSFSELFKECGMTYAYGHMAEKLKRVKSLMKDEGKVKGESMKDSLYDLANYAILTIMEIGKEEEDEK